MLKKLFVAALYIILFFGLVQNTFAQEPQAQDSFIIEEEIETEFNTELKPQTQRE